MNNERYRAIIENLREVIRESGLKQCVIAERSGYTTQQFSDILNFRKRLSAEDIPALCDVLHCTPNRLLMYEVA